jgi:hypothetical protein
MTVARQAATDHVQRPGPEAQAQRPARSRRAGRFAQHRPDARQQLARVARLGEVIVSALVEPGDAVEILAHRDSMMIAGRFGPSSRRMIDSPSSPGIIRSSTIRSGRARPSTPSSSRPS